MKRLIKRHIKKLKSEQDGMILKQDLELSLSPLYKKTLGCACAELAIEFWALKIEIWKAISGGNQ